MDFDHQKKVKKIVRIEEKRTIKINELAKMFGFDERHKYVVAQFEPYGTGFYSPTSIILTASTEVEED